DCAEGGEPGSRVEEGQNLVLMHDTELEEKLTKLKGEIEGAEISIQSLRKQIADPRETGNINTLAAELSAKNVLGREKRNEYDALRKLTRSEERPGYFWLKAPFRGTVLNSDFRQELT